LNNHEKIDLRGLGVEEELEEGERVEEVGEVESKIVPKSLSLNLKFSIVQSSTITPVGLNSTMVPTSSTLSST
jgi:hypothetical protein